MQRSEWFNDIKSGDYDLGSGERGRPTRKCENDEVQALLGENDGQTQENLAAQLNADMPAIARLLKDIGNILKVGTGVVHKLTEEEKKNQKPLANFCSISVKESPF